MPKLTPCLWFDNQAEEAANYYTSIFKNSKVLKTSKYDEASSKAAGKPKGSVMTVAFELDGQNFLALNGGPDFKFSEAVSFIINCKTQEEIDYYWNAFTKEGGEESQCGWLKDKFGVSWQVVPTALEEMVSDANSERSQRVMQAMLQMKKLDLEVLKKAYKGDKN